MLRAKFICFFVVFFITKILNAQVYFDSITPEQANSCFSCLSNNSAKTRHWCAGVYMGCLMRVTPTCPMNSVSIKSVQSCSRLPHPYASCYGCIGAGKTWCVIVTDDLTVVERKCIPKVHDHHLRIGHVDCLNGKLYNACKQDGNCDTVPLPADLTPFPLLRSCSQCLAGSQNMGWCIGFRKSGVILGLLQYCLAKSKQSQCFGVFVASPNDCQKYPQEKLQFKYDNVAKNCGTCVEDRTESWCRLNVNHFYLTKCIQTVDVDVVCRGGETFNFLKFCDHSDDPITFVHPLLMTCFFCKANGGKWCISDTPVGQAVFRTVRLCVFDTSACPFGSTEAPSCDALANDPIKRLNVFPFLPGVPQNLPDKCSTCTGRNAWCDDYLEHGARVCLPKWSYSFLCPETASAAGCTAANENRVFVDHPLYLPQNCDDCVKDGGEWCRQFVKRYEYQFCVSSAARNLCFTAPTKANCSNLKSEEKKALIPTPIPKNCAECIRILDFSWCVYNNYGQKIRICIPDAAVKALCFNGMRFKHCDIAPEDDERSLGLYALGGV